MMEEFVDLPLHPAGVYLLWWEGRVVYVGQSRAVFERLSRHMRRYSRWLRGKKIRPWEEERVIKFDRVSVKFCKERDLDRIEMEMIERFKPELNTQLKRDEPLPYEIDLAALGFDASKWNEPLVRTPRYPDGRGRLRRPEDIRA